MPNNNRKALALFRIEKAKLCLSTARIVLNTSIDYSTIANHSYYAIFHAMRAVLALDGLDFKKHSAVISRFRELYIKTGIFDTAYSKIIGDAFNIRGDSDYEDFFLVSREDVIIQLQNAEAFVTIVKDYLHLMTSE